METLPKLPSTEPQPVGEVAPIPATPTPASPDVTPVVPVAAAENAPAVAEPVPAAREGQETAATANDLPEPTDGTPADLEAQLFT